MEEQVLGDEGYEKFLKTSSETVSDSETVISRFLPDLSNVPQEIAAACPALLDVKGSSPRERQSKNSQTACSECQREG